MDFYVVIPTRYDSTRLPGKALRDIAGRPMIRHVYERAMESGAQNVVIATDDKRIFEVARGFGAQVCMTSQGHSTGTDRIAETIDQLHLPDDQIIVNLQGDDPLVPPELLLVVAKDMLDNPSADVTTLCIRIASAQELHDPNVVKVVTDQSGYALYFSRATIPWYRDAFATAMECLPADSQHYRHLGLYAYRAGFLRQFVTWAPAPMETAESLEQLRVLWNGANIHVVETSAAPPPDVNTEEDLERVAAILTRRSTEF